MFEPGSSFSSVINQRTVSELAHRIKAVHASFEVKSFIKMIDLEDQKIGERIHRVTIALEQYLPENFLQSTSILLASLPPEIPEEQAGTTFADHFIVMPMAEYIARHGLEAQHFECSMQTLKVMTRAFSSENAVRPFLERYPDKALGFLLDCTRDANCHVRRWASEGSRPRLPLAKPLRAFIENPRVLLPILEALRDDPQLYVRRSVANSLNDISKDHPDLLVSWLKKWKKGAPPERLWVIRHALRTLAKQAHPGALELLGYKPACLKISRFRFNKVITIGQDLEFSFSLRNEGDDASILIDYIIFFQKKSGQGSKVFKLRKVKMEAGTELELSGKRKLDHFSTRKMYPGKHQLVLQINGVRLAEGSFMVHEAPSSRKLSSKKGLSKAT